MRDVEVADVWCLVPVGSVVCVGIVVLTTRVSRGGW